MPTAEKIIASTGIEMTVPRKRGTTMRRIGSTPIISMAASCSPERMRPISAVSDVPARPANNSAATTGPSSRMSERATSTPSACSLP